MLTSLYELKKESWDEEGKQGGQQPRTDVLSSNTLPSRGRGRKESSDDSGGTGVAKRCLIAINNRQSLETHQWRFAMNKSFSLSHGHGWWHG